MYSIYSVAHLLITLDKCIVQDWVVFCGDYKITLVLKDTKSNFGPINQYLFPFTSAVLTL